MHFRRFDKGFSRRHFMAQASRGVLATGVLAPLWQSLSAHGSIDGVYPDELLSLDEYTGGKVGTGSVIDASNVALVKDLLDPIQAEQIDQMGRKLKVKATTKDLFKLCARPYLEATATNSGQAMFAPDGNVVTADGSPWIGGNPFPSPTSAKEVFAAATLSWGRNDVSLNAVKEYDLNDAGEQAYQYQLLWIEMSALGRLVLEPKPYWPGHEDKLRYHSVLFVSPNDIRGTSYLNIWYYDQNRYPDLYGYLPAFKRVRRFPTNQRFEPLIPGSTLYLSDAWAAGDPFLTWGNFKVVHRGPALAAVADSWNADHPNWEHTTHGGQKDDTFWDTEVEMVPEAIVVEAEPIAYPRAPVSKKRVWFDARTMLPLSMVSYDRQGQIYRSFDGAFSLYGAGSGVGEAGDPYWSWTRVHAYDIQTNRMTRLEQVRSLPGGYQTTVNDDSVYDRYMTRAALRRLGT